MNDRLMNYMCLCAHNMLIGDSSVLVPLSILIIHSLAPPIGIFVYINNLINFITWCLMYKLNSLYIHVYI